MYKRIRLFLRILLYIISFLLYKQCADLEKYNREPWGPFLSRVTGDNRHRQQWWILGRTSTTKASSIHLAPHGSSRLVSTLLFAYLHTCLFSS